MDLNQLSQFLVQAKINTYANSAENGGIAFTSGRKMFEFEQDAFRYNDIYSGFKNFSGQETVFYLGKLGWQMNYEGEVLDAKLDPHQVYDFLKKALRQVTLVKPFRGPNHFVEGNFEYINKSEGDLNKFQGKETIYFHNQEVYHLHYYGGEIK